MTTAPKKPRAPRKPPPFKLTPPEPLEDQNQRDIKKFLDRSPDVVKWWRANSGAGKLLRPDGSHSAFMRFNFPGCPDILGWLTDGTMLLVETKKWSVKHGSDEQEDIIALAQSCGCVALFARRYEDVMHAIDVHFGRIAA
jgi:hypothetical protein